MAAGSIPGEGVMKEGAGLGGTGGSHQIRPVRIHSRPHRGLRRPRQGQAAAEAGDDGTRASDPPSRRSLAPSLAVRAGGQETPPFAPERRPAQEFLVDLRWIGLGILYLALIRSFWISSQ
ncbi:hypothetical protein ZWY2020_044640 [Hordeum vulgare]|nr:hypothetical protein ZWY2020_044640 [Hordeum vulgare]